jgi:Family of unknown function (DUF6152)
MKFMLAIVLVTALAGARLVAHHSFAAEFDGSKSIRLTGTLTKVEWTNPHSYFYIDVKNEDGTVVKWGCEAGSPGALSRRGFKRGDLKLGDTVIVDGYRAKDGSNLVDARRVTLPDGRIVSGASAGDGGPVDPAVSR